MNIEEHRKRIIDIFECYKKRIIDLEELQGWCQTLLIEEFISEKSKDEFEEKLEYIRFCVTEEKRYSQVVKEINLLKEKLKQ